MASEDQRSPTATPRVARTPLTLDRDPEQQKSRAFHYRDAVYSIDEAGKRCLAKDGYVWREAKHRSHAFAHEFNIDMGFYLPLMVAVKEDPALTLIDTRAFLDHPNTPRAARESQHPFQVSIGDERVILDGRPVVLKYNETALCIPGLQHERSTKGVRVKDPDRSSVGKHLRHAIAAHEQRIYEKHYGFDNFLLPFIFTNDAQMHLALQYILELRPNGVPFIICKTIPDLAYEAAFPKPSSELLLSPWQRAGHPQFTFSERDFFPRGQT
jgi:hypothetical protein